MTTPKTDEELDALAELITTDPTSVTRVLIALTSQEKERMLRRSDAHADEILEEGRSRLADLIRKQG